MRTLFATLLLGLGSAIGCGPTTISLRALALEGRENEIALAHKYEGDVLEIRAKVTRVGQADRHVWKTDRGILGAGSSSFETYEAIDNVPFAQLASEEDEDAASLAVFCYFHVTRRDQAATLKKGAVVTLTGRFVSYRQEKDNVRESCSTTAS